MNRREVFVEYGKILDDTSDWLEDGYRREHDQIDVIPPAEVVDTLSENPPPSTPPVRTEPRIFPSVGDGPEPDRPAQLREIAGEIRECRLCDLYLTRQATVPGRGSVDVSLMVVVGPPFSSAGEEDGPLSPSEMEYLDRWLAAADLDPQRDIFITGAVKCRTPGARTPRPPESSACRSYLVRQVASIRPRALLVLGAAACDSLSQEPGKFRTLVGGDWMWEGIPALVLWTPAEVLAAPERLRRPVWEGLKRLKAAWDGLSRRSV